MKRLLLLTLFIFGGIARSDHPSNPQATKAELLPGMGNYHRPVSTRNPEAQKFFDQGLTLLYAFNHDEAAQSFARAAELDPGLAMAYWGLALVRGPNYNLDASSEEWKQAYAALQKALKLKSKASPPEQAYIDALAKRYDPDPKADRQKLAQAYSDAMKELSRRYPDDLDAATLYAESAMNLRPWKLWTPEGKPAEGTPEILEVLESVLRRNPDHPGANHYYIHAIEASPYPERGLGAAHRLKTLVPGAGHLVHMPGHIFLRLGDYQAVVEVSEKAIAADQAYIQRRKPKGAYPMMYFPHNIHFLAIAHTFQGRAADAQKAAQQLADHVGPHVKEMPMLEGFLTVAPMIQVRFQKWDEILKTPKPGSDRKLSQAFWHFTRAMAYLGKGQDKQARKEHKEFLKAGEQVPEDAKVSDWNPASKILPIARRHLEARLALIEKDSDRAVRLLREAIALEDGLQYGEPPDWILPNRELLGVVLLQQGKPAEAEKIFREALKQYPRHGRPLLGLCESLKAQGKDYEARLIDQQFQSAWRNAEPVHLRLEDF